MPHQSKVATLRTWLSVFALAFVAAAAAPAADDKAADKAGGADADNAALQGTWQTVASEVNGEKEAEDRSKQYQVVLEGDKMTITRGGETVMKGSYKLDAAQTPRQLDLKIEENPNDADAVGKTLEGIYEVKGEDLKWCFALPDRERPKAFKTEADSGQVFATLKKEKK